MCSPKHNPAFRGQGKDDELGIRIKDNIHIYKKQIHPRLQIGNYFLMMMANSATTTLQPRKSVKLWLCQVYDAIGDTNSIKFMGRNIKYKYYEMGYLDWTDATKFALFKENVFDMKRSMMDSNGGSWNDSILHFHIFRDSIDLDFINWPFEKPKGLI